MYINYKRKQANRDRLGLVGRCGGIRSSDMEFEINMSRADQSSTSQSLMPHGSILFLCGEALGCSRTPRQSRAFMVALLGCVHDRAAKQASRFRFGSFSEAFEVNVVNKRFDAFHCTAPARALGLAGGIL